MLHQKSARRDWRPARELEARLTRAGTGLLRLAATGTAVVHLALGLRVGADILEGSSVLVVGVDTGELTTIFGGDTLHVDVALALLGALR